MAQHRVIMSQQRELLLHEQEILIHKQEIETELLQVNTLLGNHKRGASPVKLKIVEEKQTGPVRVRGVLAIARKAVEQLSQPFDKKDLLAKIEEFDEELAHKITDSNIRNSLRILTQSGFIRLESKAFGKSRARYVKAA